MASLLKSLDLSLPLEYLRKAHAQLEQSENPLAKLIVQGLASGPAQAVRVRASTLFDSYGQYLIPLLGVMVQLIISSKARGWADQRREKEQVASRARKAQEEQEKEEKRKSQGIAPFQPRPTATATATGESPATARGKKGKQ